MWRWELFNFKDKYDFLIVLKWSILNYIHDLFSCLLYTTQRQQHNLVLWYGPKLFRFSCFDTNPNPHYGAIGEISFNRLKYWDSIDDWFIRNLRIRNIAWLAKLFNFFDGRGLIFTRHKFEKNFIPNDWRCWLKHLQVDNCLKLI